MKDKFTTWFLKAQKVPQATTILKDIEPRQIRRWAKLSRKNIDNYSLAQASNLTKKFLAKQKIDQIQKSKNTERQYFKNENKLRKKYGGQKCFLNGFVAFIKTSEYETPLVISHKNCINEKGEDVVELKSWFYIDKYFPFFAGGTKIYKITDDKKMIKKRIKIEKKRPKHPKQEYILSHLYNRLNDQQTPINKKKSKKQLIIESWIPSPLYHKKIIDGIKHIPSMPSLPLLLSPPLDLKKLENELENELEEI